MKTEKLIDLIETRINGNISVFNASVKRMSKRDMLHLIEIYAGNYGQRHIIIDQLQKALER